MPWTPTVNIQWDWPRCPSPLAFTPFVMLSFQCVVASSLGQSCLTAVLSGIPCVFPFSDSEYMPATKIKSLHSTAGSENIWQLCCQNLFHTAIAISRTDLGPSSKSLNPNPVNTWDHRNSFCFLLVSSHFFYRISRGQSHHKSGSLNNKYEYHSTSQSTARKSAANVRTPSITSPEPLPKRPENPSGAAAVFVGRVHRGPRRDQLLDHGGLAFPSRPMQRRLASVAEDASRKAGGCGCCRETRRSTGMFLRVVGQIFLDRS